MTPKYLPRAASLGSCPWWLSVHSSSSLRRAVSCSVNLQPERENLERAIITLERLAAGGAQLEMLLRIACGVPHLRD